MKCFQSNVRAAFFGGFPLQNGVSLTRDYTTCRGKKPRNARGAKNNEKEQSALFYRLLFKISNRIEKNPPFFGGLSQKKNTCYNSGCSSLTGCFSLQRSMKNDPANPATAAAKQSAASPKPVNETGMMGIVEAITKPITQ